MSSVKVGDVFADEKFKGSGKRTLDVEQVFTGSLSHAYGEIFAVARCRETNRKRTIRVDQLLSGRYRRVEKP